jgi:hypothetical protein
MIHKQQGIISAAKALSIKQQFCVSKRTFRQRLKLKPFYVPTENFVHKNPVMRLPQTSAPKPS